MTTLLTRRRSGLYVPAAVDRRILPARCRVIGGSPGRAAPRLGGRYGPHVDAGGGGDPTPDFALKFDGYADSVALRNAIINGDTPWLGFDQNASQISKITSISVPGRSELTAAMRFTWPATQEAQYSISAILEKTDLPGADERWVEIWARFSDGFVNGYDGAPDLDYKFVLFLRAAGSRWNVQLLGFDYGVGDNTQWGYPGVEDAWTSGGIAGGGPPDPLSGGVFHGEEIWDGLWYRHRFHLRMNTTTQGVATWYIGNREIHKAENLNITGSGFEEWKLGANMNYGPGQVQTLDWANVSIWTTSPGWGF